VRILETDPGAYVQIETILLETFCFAHFYDDDIEKLDRAAERLFGFRHNTETPGGKTI
jgi:hypothetical protein